ncbi:endolytic transglycosylase MltG [Siccirubricoccus sp. KC 17139]|uniref:Endolytic murein transglycosylase n=1 Tax=Siccirubricoccus soli TaxID=2899147 RepID=A0ABT1D0X6_9PROT|nr:endolytic transglycosylase MltG [Siccirubricoccus soli]MCO6414690.1 endolytic transglycosylase MltG [Siccirubricoccus soli]MCP2680820.1 endolytic transglycosylase MltG [Siccirubricoccus soli]
MSGRPGRRLFRWLGGTALALALLAGLGAWQAERLYREPGPLAAPAQLVIPRGGAEQIAARLAEAGVIESPHAFLAAVWWTRAAGPLRAAEFAFPAGASLAQVLDILRTARPVQRRLTIPEGLTARQILALVEGAEGLIGPAALPPEGSILPQTYAYQWGDDRVGLMRRAELAMTAALTEAWSQRAEGLPLASPREALILASIIERETGLAEERPRVAAVFLNRLRRGMPLQADSTVAYAAAGGGVLDRRLTRADLELDSPFNTYRNRGLPPAPIASPGLAALRAVMRPAESDELYFVADGNGGHAFARTLEEHNRNVARWREVERRRAEPPPVIR